MKPLPEKVRITNMGWNENRCAYKVQIGTHEETIAYAWIVGGVGDKEAYSRALNVAERICTAWNTQQAQS